MKKVLSITVPTYNVEKYLDRCIQSMVFNKEILDDIEIIIVNDGSQDSSLEIAKKYEDMYPQTIKVIDKENGGHGSTINAGLKIATGKYFRVIDSDDWVNIDDFVKLVKMLKKTDCDMVITDYQREEIFSGENERYSYSVEYDKTIDFDDIDIDKLMPDYFSMASINYRTDVLKEAKLWLDEKCFYVDMEYILLPLKYVNTIKYLDLNVYRYFIGRIDQSINPKSLVAHRKDHEKVLRRLISFYNHEKLTKNKKNYIEYILTYMLNTEYIIFTKIKIPEKKILREIKSFDKYLKKEAPTLYDKTDNYSGSIRWNRKTNFLFAQSPNLIFSRLGDFVSTRKRNRLYNKSAREESKK